MKKMNERDSEVPTILRQFSPAGPKEAARLESEQVQFTRYSERNAMTGSTLTALLAGMRQARKAIRIRNSDTSR